MRIAFICNEYPPVPHGGIGTATQLIGRSLVEAGHDVRVVGIYPRHCPAPEEEEDRGVRVMRLKTLGGRFTWVPARYLLFRTVAAWARRGEIDLIDMPDWQGLAAGWPRLPVPLVCRLQGAASYFRAELGKPLHRLTYLLERASLHRADAWCSVSEYAAGKTRELFRLATGPDAILYNPVEPAPFVGLAERSRDRVVFTGTLTEKKGVLTLARAWPEVLRRVPEAQLHIFGKDGRAPGGGSMRDHLADLFGTEARERVVFHGHQPREVLLAALAEARVAVFPSYSETFGIAPFEAMACGCPTIYTNRPPGPELLTSGTHALLVEPGDRAEVAAAITDVLADDDLAGRLSRGGHDRVRNEFSTDVQLVRNLSFYTDCLESFTSNGRRR